MTSHPTRGPINKEAILSHRIDSLMNSGAVDEPTDVHDVIPGEPCRWFAHCTLPATHMALRPIIGEVPSCDRCAKIGR